MPRQHLCLTCILVLFRIESDREGTFVQDVCADTNLQLPSEHKHISR